MKSEMVDYRNAKYQGNLLDSKRESLGILIDDDLNFYISHWQANKLNNLTLIYHSHGKYMYGYFKNGEPQGLNVYRCGDTVLVGQYQDGRLTGRVLAIFQRISYLAVLEVKQRKWKYLNGATLTNHQKLLEYIKFLEVDVPDHFYSLTKFVCHISNISNASSVRTFPCENGHCYFGFINGLGIIFNTNNGVVSVGWHKGQQIREFGGKYLSKQEVEEGNFEIGDLVRYSHDRPFNKIYAIYQKLHKKSLNFKNEYFDSRVGILNKLEFLLRGKILGIIEKERSTEDDLNDSLDYKDYKEEEIAVITQKRNNIYSPKKSKLTIKIEEEAVIATRINTPERGNKHVKQTKQINQALYEQYQLATLKTPSRKPQRSLSRLKQEDKETKQQNRKQMKQQIKKQVTQQIRKQFMQQSQKQMRQPNTPVSPINRSKLRSNCVYKGEAEISEEDSYKVPTFKEIKEEPLLQNSHAKITEKYKNMLLNSKKVEERAKNKRDIAVPQYEDIQQRRRRIMKEFRDLNEKTVQPIPKEDKPIPSNRYESPCQGIAFSSDHNSVEQSSFGYIPLSLQKNFEKEKLMQDIQNIRKDIQISDKSHQKIMKSSQRYKEENTAKFGESQWWDNKNENKWEKCIEIGQGSGRDKQRQNQPRVQLPLHQTDNSEREVTPTRKKREFQYVY